jgi:uncharacterized membrane protein
VEYVETQEIIVVISEAIAFAGAAIIALGALIGVILCAQDLLRQERAVDACGRLRTFLGRSLLLGLEFLVAGDIIKTVAIAPTFNSVVVLSVIVLVRTVLSLSIDVEIDGRWPGKRRGRQVRLRWRRPGRQTPSPALKSIGGLMANHRSPSLIASGFLRS